MTRKLLVFPLSFFLAGFVSGVSAFGAPSKGIEPGTSAEVKETSARAAPKANAKLKSDMKKLLSDAKAGKVAPRPQQFPQTTRSNMSKTTKIALIASAVGAAITLIWLHAVLTRD